MMAGAIMIKRNNYISLEEKYVTLQSDLKREIWKSISFDSAKDLFDKAENLFVVKFNYDSISLEHAIIFFMDFFNLLLKCRFLHLNNSQLNHFKKILISKGVRVLVEYGENFDNKILNYKNNDCDLFYPVKILERILFCDEKEFVKIVGFLTEGEYPQDCILQKWTVEYGQDRYLEDY